MKEKWVRIMLAHGLLRWVLIVGLIALTTAAPKVATVHATGALLVASPSSNLPHGLEMVSGSGFDPLAQVALSLTSSTGTTTLDTLSSDAGGNLTGSVTLPLTLDVTTANTIIAQEVTGTTAATTTVTGLALAPSLAGPRQITGRLGQTLFVHALGFAPTEPLTVTIGGVPVGLPATAPNGFVTSPSGSQDLTFTVPVGAPPGADSLVVSGGATGLGQIDSASITINVVGNQNLVVTPSSGVAGRTVEVAGSGYAAAEQVAITLSYSDAASNGTNEVNLTTVADEGGSIDTRLPIPPTAKPGTTAILRATGAISGLIQVAEVALRDQPTISADPPGVEPGQPLTIRGVGFVPGDRVFLSTSLFKTPAEGLIVDATGAISGSFALYQRLKPGVYGLSVTSIDGELANGSVTVPPPPTPHLALTPALAMPGDNLQVIGSRFLANEPVLLSLDTTPVTPTSGPITASMTGAFATTVQVPSFPVSGTYLMNARGLDTGAIGSSTLNVRLPTTNRTYFTEGYTGQGPLIDFSENLNLSNTNAVTASGLIAYALGGSTSTVPITVPITIGPRSQLVENVAHDVGNNQLVSAIVETDQTIQATRTISRTTVGGTPLAESVSNGERALSPFWYFAEGYTGSTYQEYVEIFNPQASAASVTLAPLSGAGAQPSAPISRIVPPHARITINLRAVLPSRSLGILVQADRPIAAERVLYWGAGSGSGKYGTAVSAGVSGPAAVWNFPYVSTAVGDQTFVSMIDPTTQTAHVVMTMYGDTGVLRTLATITVTPGTRLTLRVPDRSDGKATPRSIVVSSDVPIVAEESQYFGGSPNIGMHAGSIMAGMSQRAEHWLFPSRDTGHYSSQAWYVLNPGPGTAQLTATLYDTQAQPLEAHFRAASGRLTTISLQDMRQLQNGGPSVWSSSAPVVIVQVLRGADPAAGVIVSGIATG